jgi:hypothetical protein
MQVIKAERTIHRTPKVDGQAWLVFAEVIDCGIRVAQHGFRFWTKKDALAFIAAH